MTSNASTASATSSSAHQWHFFRAGGVDQVLIRNGADIANLRHLDQKLWVALACPTRGVELDAATLAMLDADGDGRIRAPELLAATEWAVAHVQDAQLLASGRDAVAIADIRADAPDGAGMREQALRILSEEAEAAESAVDETALITLAQVTAHLAKLNALPLNGDGIVNPEKIAPLVADATRAEQLSQLARFIMGSHGSVQGIDGQPGLNRATLDAFFADVQALDNWWAAAPEAPLSGASAPAPNPGQVIEPFSGRLSLAQATAAAAAIAAMEQKVSDFFIRTQLAAFDASAAAALAPTKEGYAALSASTLGTDAVAALPLVVAADASGALPLSGAALNPAWGAPMAALREHAVATLLGDTGGHLTQAQWQRMLDALAATRQWLASQPAQPIAQLTREQTAELLQGGLHAELAALIECDEAARVHAQHTRSLEKLLRLQRDAIVVLNNFVSFADFYRRKPAAFQAGTLYLDARSCELTVDVADTAAHAALAGMAKTYLAYCECRRKNEKGELQKKNIVAAFTAGDVDFLFVGRNGIFYDRQNNDWDATITKIIENPTSIGQAFFSPYKKFVRMVEEQIAKRATAKEGEVTANLDARAAELVTKPTTAAASLTNKPADAAMDKKMDVGTVAALGVALGSISTVLVAIFGKFVEMGPWIPVGLLGLILAISGPSMLIAWLKLRERTLGPILDASGWAINGRMKINLPLGRSLSQLAKTPANARRSFQDPYAAPSPTRWLWPVLMLIVIAAVTWWLGWLNPALPERWQRQLPSAAALQAVPSSSAAPAVVDAATPAPDAAAQAAVAPAPAQ